MASYTVLVWLNISLQVLSDVVLYGIFNHHDAASPRENILQPFA